MHLEDKLGEGTGRFSGGGGGEGTPAAHGAVRRAPSVSAAATFQTFVTAQPRDDPLDTEHFKDAA